MIFLKRLCYILLFAVLAAGISGCKEKKEKRQRFPLQLVSEPSSAKVFYKGNEKGKTPFSCNVAPGSYVLKVEKEGYEPEWVNVDMTNKEEKVEVRLRPLTADVLIDSKPSEAKVYIKGRYIGETPVILKDQRVGHGKGVIKKLNYVEVPVEWVVKDSRPVKVSASLHTNVGLLEVTSIPSQAEVYINGKYFGLTPVKKKVEQGNVKIKVSKKGFADFEDMIVTRRNETVKHKISLQKLPGMLTVTSAPSGATISLNGEEQSARTPATFKSLSSGKYTVRIEKSGFDPEEKSVDIPQGGSRSLHFDLGTNTGGIDLVANPPGVTIYLDGKEKGVSEPDEDGKFSKVFKIRGVVAGTHEITVAHKRAEPQKKSVRVVVAKGKISRPKPVSMWIANAVLKLKTGRKMVGCLRSETPLEIFFEPTPGVRQGFKRNEIEYLEMLKEEE